MPAALLNLPVLLGVVRQEAGCGELVLEQNDGTRRFRFRDGGLVSLRSDAAGEQLGGWLLRKGVLDLASLNQLLADDARCRIGEKLVQRGLLGIRERDVHLQDLQEQILVHALEHPVLRSCWNPGASHGSTADPDARLQDRHLIWRTLQESRRLRDLDRVLELEVDWAWRGREDLLDTVRDLPLSPSLAYAIGFFAGEPIDFRTFCTLGNLEAAEAGRLLAALWALGAVSLCTARVPTLAVLPRSPGPGEERDPLPLIPPPAESRFGPPKQTLRTRVEPEIEVLGGPEYLDLEPDPLQEPDSALARRIQALVDAPPCGPRAGPAPAEPRRTPPALPAVPPPLPEGQTPWPMDLPPCGPRPAKQVELPVQAPSVRSTNPPGRPLDDPPVRSTNPPGSPLAPLSRPDPPRTPAAPTAGAPIELDPEHKGPGGPVTAESLQDQARAARLLAQARRQAGMGRTVEAVRTLEEAAALQYDGDPAYEVWLMLGRLQMQNPAWSARAIHALQTASVLRPRETEPLRALADAFRRAGAEADANACQARIRDLEASAPGLPKPWWKG